MKKLLAAALPALALCWAIPARAQVAYTDAANGARITVPVTPSKPLPVTIAGAAGGAVAVDQTTNGTTNAVAIKDGNTGALPSLAEGTKGAPAGTVKSVQSVNSTLVTGQAKVAVTATAVQFQSASAALQNGAVFCALAANGGKITVGGSSVNNTTDGTGNGAVLAAGQCASIAVTDANLLYVDGAAGDGLWYMGN